MNRFQATLARIDEQLRLPRSTRSRILLEMSADLEDLFQHYRSQGLGEAEAARRAEEAVAVSDKAMERLLAVHRPGVDRFTENLAGHVAGGWQKALFAVLTASAVVIVGQAVVASQGFLRQASDFVWPVLGLGGLALAVVLAKLYVLVVRPYGDVRRLRSGLGVLLFAAVGSVAVGVDGFLIELFLFLRGFAEGRLDQTFLIAVSSMMIVAMVTAILAALAWLVLVRWFARLENREADELLRTG